MLKANEYELNHNAYCIDYFFFFENDIFKIITIFFI